MPEDPPTDSQRILRRVGLLVLTTSALAIMVAAVANTRWSPPGHGPRPARAPVTSPRRIVDRDRLPRYVGAAACRECHPGEAALQARSGHQRTLWRVGDGALEKWLSGRRLRDPVHPDV